MKGGQMAKLNQIIAVEQGVKGGTQRDLAEAFRPLQKPALLAGLSRTYQPKDEEGEQLPPESTRVQVKSEAVLRAAGRVNELVDRIEKLSQAVKFAREEANGAEVTDRKVGDVVFRYLFR